MYFLTILASLSLSTIVPRALRTNLAVRLIMPCRLPCAATFTLPPAVILKRFLAPLLVFSFGIASSFLDRRLWRKFRVPVPAVPPVTPRTQPPPRPMPRRRRHILRLIRPTPRLRKGTYAASSARRQHHDHLAALHARLRFDLGDRF